MRALHRWSWIGTGSAVVCALGALYQPAVVLGNSMSPTLSSGRVIWLDRGYYRNHRPRRGEVVVFRVRGQTYVKRVYRAPGETVHYLSRGGEWVAPVREARVEALRNRYAYPGSSLRINEMRVPEDSVYVLGDNYNASVDSRELGLIPIRSLLGRAHLETNAIAAMPYELRWAKGTTGHP